MIASLLRRSTLFAIVWWTAAEGSLAAWPLALAGIVGATLASLWMLPPGGTPHLSIGGLFAFLGYFIRQSLAGGWQVARLACRPRMDLDPGLLELPLKLPPGLPRLLFTATLGLMPGTLGVRLGEQTLFIHVLDRQLPVAEEAAVLAGHIARLLKVAP